MDPCYYLTEVQDLQHKGWLVVREGDLILHIPFGARFNRLEQRSRTERVELLDGPHSGRVINLPYLRADKSGFYSYLKRELPFRYQARKAVFYRKAKRLVIDEYKVSVIYEGTLIAGSYEILSPVYKPLGDGHIYLNERRGGSRFAETWFPVVAKGKVYTQNFIHFGRMSEGCLTVQYNTTHEAANNWVDVYQRLITSRVSSSVHAELEIL